MMLALALALSYMERLIPLQMIVPLPGIEPNEALKAEILEYCKQHISKYALPREVEFRSELPKTLVGKVAYRKLEEEANRAEIS